MKRILYAIAGAGMGNLTRMLAILGKLGKERFDITVVSQPRFQQQINSDYVCYNLEDVNYGVGEFSVGNILRSNLSLPFRVLKNYHRCETILDEVRPDALIVDSDFHCLKHARDRGIPRSSMRSGIVGRLAGDAVSGNALTEVIVWGCGPRTGRQSGI
jgi:UDP:flavonoid glycosyltransferase YjiC (YdhE family)